VSLVDDHGIVVGLGGFAGQEMLDGADFVDADGFVRGDV